MIYTELQEHEELKRQAAHLRELREERGWNKKQAYEKLVVTAKTYDTWERGEKKPNTQYLLELATLYGVSTDYILGKAESKNPGNAELSQATGLSETSIEVLRFMQSYETSDDEYREANKRTIDLINRVLEGCYSQVIDYKNNENFPVVSVFSTMMDYIDPGEASLQYRTPEGERIEVEGKFVTITMGNTPTGYSINKLKKEFLINRIRNEMDQLAEEKEEQ